MDMTSLHYRPMPLFKQASGIELRVVAVGAGQDIAAARHPHVKQALAQQFADWITSAPWQAAIASYRIDGERLFVTNAPRP